MVVCENYMKTINCTGGLLIMIKRVLYGRRDTITCCSTLGAKMCALTTCSLDITSIYSNLCNSYTSCVLRSKTKNDPCVGTYKYLEASWECVYPGKKYTKPLILVWFDVNYRC